MNFPAIDPVIFSLGPLHIRWYGLMYVLGFTASYFLVKKQISQTSNTILARHFENLNFVLIISVILGGRLGYVLFYNFRYYLHHPLEILATWQGGMSFHGACLALIMAGWLFCRANTLNFWKTADIYVVTIPIGLGLGRIGNYINGELYGRVTDVPWGVVFPGGGPWMRHPSQLYEAFLEGLVLFIILWSLRGKSKDNPRLWPQGTMLALFLSGYGFFRFMVEFTREPDPQIGYLLGPLTMGQILSSIMIAGGVLLWWLRKKTVKR
ncbi:MAG: prolipoprotein diacylglyceryl transferase [Desulfopila sp.]|jgi:phosphatidylglycerol:prolipoprotein diacylglycerol transferase|nr:prolipoprotein diacylglyceryl transferase [Desulfopila sp.]